MIKINPERRTAVLYPCATCNLNCSYCNINKTPILKKIDEELQESFKGDYYFERIHSYFPLKHQLKQVETWGGEPFLHMERIHYTLEKLIEYYPYLNSFFSSTNFSFLDWNDKIYSLFNIFGKYPERKFTLNIQLSCDGPEKLNDQGRGQGTTKKCLKNLEIFLKRSKEIPKNIEVILTIKPTLNIETLLTLDTKEKIIQYFKFFEEEFYKKISLYPNLKFLPTVPNMAVPTPATKEIGEKFALYCKNCKEIEEKSNELFLFQKKITPYNTEIKIDEFFYTTYLNKCNYCGSGSSLVGFLPNNLISVCNEGFSQLSEEYLSLLEKRDTKKSTILYNKNSNKRILCLTDEEYSKYEECMKGINNLNKSVVANHSLFIKALAYSGLIKEKYKNDKEALRAARQVLARGFCVKDNYNMTGSMSTIAFGTIILLCNGALEYL